MPARSPTSYNQQAGGTQAGPIQTAIRLWFNPGLSSKKFYGPGIFVLGLSMFPPLLAALAMAKEGELKTILQVYVSSIPAHEFLLGKIIAFMAVALAECLVMSGASVHLFWPELCRRSYARLDRHRPLCLLRGGVWNHGRSDHPQPGSGLASGGVRRISARVPAFRPDLPDPKHTGRAPLDLNFVWGRYYIEIVRDALLQGGGWPAVWYKVLIIGAIGAIFYGLAWQGMRRMQVKA
jgi:ABC-2 type transport system permease protein